MFDGLLGSASSETIRNQVLALYKAVAFEDGEVGGGSTGDDRSYTSGNLRADKVLHVSASTPHWQHCPGLKLVLDKADTILSALCTAMSELDRVNERSAMMVACYPGGGSHYVRHIDNPDRNGRVLTFM